MGELKNTFSWSVSKDRCFRFCRREYFYNYYGCWGGWALDAPEEVRKAYILKNIISFPLWGGSIVHDIIKATIEGVSNGAAIPALPALQEEAVQRLRRGWIDSRSGKWQRDPKRVVNLFEHYYGEADGVRITQEEADEFKAGVLNALEAFWHSDTLRELVSLPMKNWRCVDTLESFEVECDGISVPVWCAIDLAYVDAAGKFHIVDWKTGREHREELLKQLAFYAYYAMHKWQVSLGDILLEGVLLNDGGRISPYTITQESITAAMEQMKNSVRQMKKALSDPEENIASIEDFPPCGIPERCEGCRFKELCRQEFSG